MSTKDIEERKKAIRQEAELSAQMNADFIRVLAREEALNIVVNIINKISSVHTFSQEELDAFQEIVNKESSTTREITANVLSTLKGAVDKKYDSEEAKNKTESKDDDILCI